MSKNLEGGTVVQIELCSRFCPLFYKGAFNKYKKKKGVCGPEKPILVKFVYSEKATKFCKISIVDLTDTI